MELKLGELELKDVTHFLTGAIKDSDTQFVLVANPEITFNQAMQILQSMTTHLLYTYAEQHPEAKDDIYDAYNMMASTTLDHFMPSRKLDRDFDEEAILELQAKKIEEAYESMSDDDKEAAAKALLEIKDRLKQSGTEAKNN